MRLLLAFFYARPATVILLDEPDAHQHVILQKQVYELIRKIAHQRGGQVILATHSEVVLDSTEPSRVIGFFGRAPHPLTSEVERDRLREALKRITTSDLLLGSEIGSVLYVEGETDEKLLGAGHSSSGETLCGRVIAALKCEALLNESVGAGYIERNWPLASLRQSFLNGSLTRLVDPDAILKSKIVEFVSGGDLGLASGRKPDGSYERVWFEELVAPDEVVFDAGVFLLTKDSAKARKSGSPPGAVPA